MNTVSIDNGLKLLVGKVLNLSEDSERLKKVVNILEENGVTNEGDLIYLNKDDFRGELTDEEFKTISNPILRMSIDEGIREILNSPRPMVVKCFRKNGCSEVSDLKYFDWYSLEELNCLSEMEIQKIMRFVERRNVTIDDTIILLSLGELEIIISNNLSKNFPEEYNEHKAVKTEKDLAKQKHDLLDFQASLDKKTQEISESSDTNILIDNCQVLEDAPHIFNETSRSEEAMPFEVLPCIYRVLAITHALIKEFVEQPGELTSYRDIELD